MTSSRAGSAGGPRVAGLVLAAILLASGFLELGPVGSVAAAGAPQVTILSPAQGQVVGNGTAVYVQLSVANFSLVQPGRVGEVPVPGEGYANVFLDTQYVRLVTDLRPFPLTAAPGNHTLRVELVDDNGAPLVPDASATVHFTATRGPAMGLPTLAVVTPTPLETTGHGLWLSLTLSNFSLVGAYGQPNAPNEGHIQVLVLGAVVEEFTTYAPVILVSLPDGDITITVRLVNNDGSPLNPDVSVTVPIHVTASSSVTLPLVINGGVALLLGFTLVILLLRRRSRVAKGAKPVPDGPPKGGGSE